MTALEGQTADVLREQFRTRRRASTRETMQQCCSRISCVYREGFPDFMASLMGNDCSAEPDAVDAERVMS